VIWNRQRLFRLNRHKYSNLKRMCDHHIHRKNPKNTNRMNILKQPRAFAALALSFSILVWPACGRQQREKGSAENPVLPNFHQVDQHVYRGGQPGPEGWQSLAKMGVKTVIDLRREDEHSTAAEAQAVAAAGMRYVNVPMKGIVAPTNEQVAKVLALLNSQEPVFVHCKRGADRTGTVIACYRIEHDRWQRQQALEEAKSLGMSLVQIGLKHYIMEFQPTQ
jgi:tyrosine-protein phosphatase SIW14